MKLNYSFQSGALFLGILLVAACSNPHAYEQQQNNKFKEAKQSEQTYLKAAELIGQLIGKKSYTEALSSARGMQPGFLKASMLMQISAALRKDGKTEQANTLLDEALDELRFEGNAALKASTLAFLSDEYRLYGDKGKASRVLTEARTSLDKIDRFETGMELSAVFAVAKSYAREGDIKTAKAIAQKVNAQPGDSLMSAIDSIAGESNR